MVTRSIVGRFLIVSVLLVSLGVIAEAGLKISAETGRKVAKADPAPARATAAAAPATAADTAADPAPVPDAQAADAAPVRVVYPGPLGDAPVQPRKIADAAPALPAAPAPAAQQEATSPPAPPPPAAPALQDAQAAAPATPPTDVQVASADSSVGLPAADPAPAKGGIDLNTASVDALNRLGGGHIGQSIVKHRPYRTVEDLVKKRVVRRSVYEQIKNQIAAD